MADEVNLPAEPEVPQQETPVAPQPETTPEPVVETIPFKVRGEERQLRSDAVRALAEDLGYDDPQAVVNQLQMAKDAADVYRQARELYKRSRTPEAPEPQYQPQQPQYQPPQSQQPRYAPQPAEEDPVALVRDIHGQVQQLAEMQRQMYEATQAQLQAQAYQRQREEAKLIREAQSTYQQFASELKQRGTPDHRVPDMEYLLEEAESMGMFNTDLPINEIYRRTYRMLYADDLAQQAASEATQKLRNPKATVVVPGARSAAPAPAPPGNTIAGMEAQLGGLTMADIIDSLPKAR